ncbi:MAG: hypothetical protein N2654_03385 [Deltaproteobacteria bacterium]|nr:hypothetical protein [Deltaproteobacteria bacterium]
MVKLDLSSLANFTLKVGDVRHVIDQIPYDRLRSYLPEKVVKTLESEGIYYSNGKPIALLGGYDENKILYLEVDANKDGDGLVCFVLDLRPFGLDYLNSRFVQTRLNRSEPKLDNPDIRNLDNVFLSESEKYRIEDTLNEY